MKSLWAIFVARILGLPRFVARAALSAALFHAAFVGGVTLIKSGTNALFLSRADAAWLPWLYAAVAVVVAVSTAILARLQSRFALRKLFGPVLVVNAILVVAGTVGIVLDLPGAPGVLYVLGEATATTGSVLFWSRVMDGFTSRDQKRVVGVVGAGGMLGAAVGGVLMRLLAAPLGVLAPILGAAIVWLIALPLMRVVRARSAGEVASTTTAPTPAKNRERRTPEGSTLTSAMVALFAEPYQRTIAFLVVLLAATGAAVDFVFRATAATQQSEAEMAGLFGLLNAVVGIVVVFLQAGLTARTLARVGVFVFAAVVPTLLVVVSVAHAGVVVVAPAAAFGVLIALKGIEMAGAYSLHPAAVALLYNPIPPERRSQARTLIDGAIKKMGAAAAGLLLGALATRLGIVSVWTVCLTSALTLLCLPALRRRYLEALRHRLQASPQPAQRQGYAIDPADKDTRIALERGLLSDASDDVIAALDTLGPRYELDDTTLLTLLKHEDERVRSTALARVPTRPDHRLASHLLAIARSPGARRPRAEAVRALAKVQPGRAADVVLEFLDDDEPGVVCAALEVTLRTKKSPRAQQRLDALLVDVAALPLPWRRELARLLGGLRDPRAGATIETLMADDDDATRAIAIEAAARRGDPAHVDTLVRRLGEPKTRASVAVALVRFGDGAIPVLRQALDDTTLAVATRLRIPTILERIGSDAAAQTLLFSNPRDDASLQARIARALAAIAEKHPGVLVDRRRTDEAIGRRLVAVAAYADAVIDLEADLDGHDDNGGDGPSFRTRLAQRPLRLLRRVVEDRRRQNLEIALLLLGIHRDAEQMQVVLRGLLDRRRQARLDAIELLDAALVADPLRADFLSLLDEREYASPSGAALPRIDQLTSSKDPLLRGIAGALLRSFGEASDDDENTQTGSLLPGSFELEGPDMADELVERLFLLEDVDLFHGLAADDLLAIASIAREHVVESGQYLYREEEAGSHLFVIIEGAVELTRRGRPVMNLHAGETVGQISFVDKGPRPVSCRVTEAGPARLLVVDREQFFDVMADRPSLMHAFFDVLALRLRTLIDRPA